MSRQYLNKSILIGISFLDEKDNIIETYQTSWIIVNVKEKIIEIKRKDKSIYSIPNDDEAIKEAKPWTYREKITWIEVINPDYITTWSIHGKNSKKLIEQHKKVWFIPKD